ncbi:hypothetical protein Val02_66470 [Virgisporangium aliadipatigenens]|uniref:Uncharacterized protein n=1 Tax=Virgisporangium aliadipatigenens TaxID=741659 RepID=A0A8J3YTY4_9ACTN|nr:hypothetical protein [Virgisporangium aliadipatigenens]GIJ49761.1 hypothetical protein Val02_66470 [Virgisporangium aliadipatigenens]
MSENPNATASAADTVARALAEHPEGITTRDLATKAGIGASTTAKALAAMETAGTAVRTPGAVNGGRKSADLWQPVITPQNPIADDASNTEEAPKSEGAPSVVDDAKAVTDDAPVTETAPRTGDEVPPTGDINDAADDASVLGSGTGDGDAGPTADTPGDEAPVAAMSRQPDLKVLIMAGVLGDHLGGVTATDAITESGLAPAVGDTILAAMEVAGAARRLPVANDGTELWVRGDGDLATVDPAKAPTHIRCQACGQTRPVRRSSATGRRTNGTGGVGRAAGGVNSDGSQKLAKGELERLVEAFIRDLGPGHDVSPVIVGRELGGRSSGACGNAMDKLTAHGVLVLTSEAPRAFALADNPPPPSAEVVALMTRPAGDDSSGDADIPVSSDTPSTNGVPTADEARAA